MQRYGFQPACTTAIVYTDIDKTYTRGCNAHSIGISDKGKGSFIQAEDIRRGLYIQPISPL